MIASTQASTDCLLVSRVTSGLSRGFVGVVDPGEAHALALGDGVAGLGVEALDVAGLADVDRGVAVDLDEVALGRLAGVVAWGLGRG